MVQSYWVAWSVCGPREGGSTPSVHASSISGVKLERKLAGKPGGRYGMVS
jgi:hypothetical protein